MGIHNVFARGTSKYPGNTLQGFNQDAGSLVVPILNAEGFLVDPQRVLTHPSFPALEGQGIFTYDYNPDITRNFIYSPTPKVDTTVQKTLGSSIVVQQVQFLEDTVITEVWTGGGVKLSTLASMFRTFYTFWTTLPDPGEYLVWEPKDRTSESYGVRMINVTLGSIDIEYKEFPVTQGTSDGAFLNQQLTVQFKIVAEDIAPLGTVTLEGL
jgi:hypothetical protein